jgi:uncharacterized protein (TIGR02284 family)
MTLSTKEILEECNDLIRFDHDAIGAYDEAIDGINEMNVKDPLLRFRGDHERHVLDLSAVVRRLGGEPPERPGFRGIVRKTMTKVAGLGGTEMILKAMRSNEEVLNKQYGERMKKEFPADILEIITRNYSDEQRHLAWVEQALQTRIWEQQPSPQP